jgi:choline-phosphate cytidylyltransferase/glycerol-3-phosphate cytidylyltransferase
MKMKVFFSGTFDLLNCGHIRSFDLAKQQGDELIVGLNTDDIIRSDKGREPIIPFDQRKEILEAIRFIDHVIKIDNILHLEVLKELDADVYVCNDEWKERQKDAIEWIIAKGGRIFVPPYFPDDGITLSSTMIRQRIISGSR